MGKRFALGLTFVALAAACFGADRDGNKTETEMEAALEAARRANVKLPADLQLKYAWSLPLKSHLVAKDGLWVDKDYVVAVAKDHHLHLIRKRDGVVMWMVELDDKPMYRPVITSKAMYVVVKNYIVCIDLAEGEIVWRIQPDFPISSAPIVREPDIYVGSWDNKLYTIEIRSRQRIWHKAKTDEGSFKGMIYYFFPSWHLTTKGHITADPQEYEGFIYFPSEDGHLYSISRDGDLRYKAATQAPIKAAPAIKGDRAYVGSTDFSLYCFNRLTGSEIWHFPTGADVLKKPYVDRRSQLVYCPSNKNGVFGIKDDKSGRKLWHIEDAEDVLAVGKEIVYLGLRRNRLLAVDKRDGTALWISLLRGVRFYATNYESWAKGKPARLYMMLRGNVLVCMEEVANQTAPLRKTKKAKK